VRAWLAISLLLPLPSCDLFYPENSFTITETDSPIKSATLDICDREYPLLNVGGEFQTSARFPEDCEINLRVIMVDGDEVMCRIGYASSVVTAPWLLWVKNRRCGGAMTLTIRKI
jgi:hypothetical protein